MDRSRGTIISQVNRFSHKEGIETMTRKQTLSFRFNVPSVLTFDWVFEFRCALVIDGTQPVVVTITDATIGSVKVTIPYSYEDWKIRLAIWYTCQRLALNYAVKTNTYDRELSLFTNRASNTSAQ